MKDQGFEKQEIAHQRALLNWAKYMSGKCPDLEYIYHVPNEEKSSQWYGRQLVSAGLRSGVPELVLPSPRGQYHGLYIELKVQGRKPTEHQIRRMGYLGRKQYCTMVCNGFNEAQKVIEEYMGLPQYGNPQRILRNDRCPFCGHVVPRDIEGESVRHCPYCGTGIDWRTFRKPVPDDGQIMAFWAAARAADSRGEWTTFSCPICDGIAKAYEKRKEGYLFAWCETCKMQLKEGVNNVG